MHRWGIALLLAVFLSSCGYRILSHKNLQHDPTVSIPYIPGDSEGAFTTALIEAVSTQGPLQYLSNGEARYRLNVEIVSSRSENVGFQFPRSLESEKDRLVASQKRKDLLVKFSLEDLFLGEEAIPVQYLSESNFFDFLPIGAVEEDIIEFSLGQLDSESAAKGFAQLALYQRLAQKVADRVYSEMSL